MKMEESIPKFIEKLKSEHQLKGKIAERILDSIAENLSQIESSKSKMEADAQAIISHPLKGDYKIPYGFTENRFSELKIHPGIDIIVKAETANRALFKQLGLSIEHKEEEKVKTSKLMKLRKIK